MAALPLEPRLAAMIVAAADAAHRALAAEIAAVVGEPGLGGDSIDLRDRITRFRQERSARAAALRALAARWAKGAEPASVDRAGAVVAAAFPQFLARRRGQARGRFLTAGGRAADIAADDALAGVDWLAIAAMTGTAGGGRVLAAAPLAEADALAQAETSDLVAFDAARKALTARRVRRIGAIVLSETPLAAPAGAAARAALLDAVRAQGLDLLDAHNAVCVFLARLAAARKRFPDEWPDWTEADLLARADSWLAPLLGDPPSLSRPNAEQLQKALAGLLDRRAARTLDDIAPVKIAAPSGRALAVDYRAAAGPSVAAPVQEFFGAAAHPSILRGGERLLVTLLSPAGRPVAATRDLPGFWAGAYRDMAKDMRARYPKHDWPDDPAAARPHAGKPRARRRKET
jgi:ATP-dependent helicase HrpB